jgi:hypothetical protein
MTMTTVPPEVIEPIRVELRKLVDAPDLDKSLVAIAKLAKRAKDLFMVLKDPVHATVGPRSQFMMNNSEESDDLESASTGVLFSPNTAETFGAKAIRELVGALPAITSMQRDTPEALVRAIADARIRGLTDVSAELEMRLVQKRLDGDRPVDSTAITRKKGSLLAPRPLVAGLATGLGVQEAMDGKGGSALAAAMEVFEEKPITVDDYLLSVPKED